MELVIVGDGSTDRTREIMAGLQDEHIVTCQHASNRGAGTAIRTACAGGCR
jgi:glycosyltransferase involved in cell wall biosynthesis